MEEARQTCLRYEESDRNVVRMARKQWQLLRVAGWTLHKKLFIFLLVTVSFMSVWISTSDKRTLIRDFGKISVENSSFPTTRQVRSKAFPTAQTIVMNSSDDEKYTEQEFTAVILLTYMRSGSSFTGEILQQSEDVFYVFEPLRVLSYLQRTRTPISWFNKTQSMVDTVNIDEVKRQSLIGWLTCNFSMIITQAFDDYVFLSFGKKTAKYNDCVVKSYGNTVYSLNDLLPRKFPYIRTRAVARGLNEKCLQDLQNVCKSSKVKIVKTIRTNMSLTSDIMNAVKQTKVVNLIRDPRTTVISQYKYQGCPGTKPSLFSCAIWHCGNVLSDAVDKQKYEKEKPSQFLTVFYEHIASFPSEIAKVLYTFLSLNFTENIKKYAINLVKGENNTECKVCQQVWQNRSVLKWTQDKKELLTKFGDGIILEIQNICSDVINYYGYEFYNNTSSAG